MKNNRNDAVAAMSYAMSYAQEALTRYKKDTKMVDNVNHPSHYETGKIECIDVIIETQGVDAAKAFCVCNALKYLYRHNNKNGVEDIRKAQWYINKYLELCESNGILLR